MLKIQHTSLLEAGTDEAGRGALAGPVTAAAVVMPIDVKIPLLNDSKKLYTLSQSNTGGMWRIEKLYTLLEDGIKPVLSIKYSYKKWKENIEIHNIDLSDSSLDLIIYGLFIMRRLQSAESAGSGIGVYG